MKWKAITKFMVGKTINNYIIDSVLGEGGMGNVYLATHKFLETKAAIKILHPHLTRDQQIKERFINEAIALSRLNSPYIVKIKDFFDYGDNLFLIMEYIEGTGLDVYIREINGPIPEYRAKEIFIKVLSGVNDAHIKGVIHRDIKPSNIILQQDDTPKILDFGIAKLNDRNPGRTAVGTRIGSLIYMSPEQVLGREIDIRTDIYSLGLTLYEMLTAKNPYDFYDGSEYTINNKIIGEPIIPPSSIYPAISRHAEEVVYKATAKNPDERFRSCVEFGDAIKDVHFTSGIEIPQFTINSPINVSAHHDEAAKPTEIRTSSEIFNELASKTALNKSLESVGVQTERKAKSRKTKSFAVYYLSGIFLILFVIAIAVIVMKNSKNDVIKLPPTDKKLPTENKPPETKPKTNITSEKNIDLDENSPTKKTKKQKSYSSPKQTDVPSPRTRGHTTFK